MTLLVAIHMGKVGLIAADKAEVCIDSAGDMHPVHQQADKIVHTPFGVVTGCGLVELLTPVKEHLQTAKICYMDQVLSAIHDARNSFSRSHPESSVSARALQTTGWLASYSSPAPEGPGTVLKMAAYHPSLNQENLVGLESYRAKCFPPSDFTFDEAVELDALLNEKMQLPGDNVDISEALAQNMRLIVETMQQVARTSLSVSSVCDIAVVWPGGQKILNEVDENNLISKWSELFG
ncbi:hypothetical protein [Vreelandella hamiltonii]|uniref:hypothetical protein n=1 Tax=Vreelandella hamiltonii TaxID=502829 RepID=UPI00167A466C|nr:hypothetical protein [Halomonas hamiltonii]